MIPYFSYNQMKIFGITLYPWGFFLGLAFLFSYLILLRESKKENIEEKKIFWLFFWIFLGVVIGSRLGYVFQFSNYYFENPVEIFKIAQGGLMFYGGFIGALILGWRYVRKNKLNFLKIGDILAPAIAFGIFLGRIGCFLINDHQGAITGLPWAIKWMDGTLRHPIALYLSLNGLILFFLLKYLKNRLRKPGQLFFVFIFYYAFSRFLLDFLRASETVLSDLRYYQLTISQWISLLILVILGICYWKRRRFF